MIALGTAATTVGATAMAACGGATSVGAEDAAEFGDAALDHRDVQYSSVEAYGAVPMCPEPVASNDIPEFKPPIAMSGACTDADVAAFTAETAKTTSTFTDVYEALATDACRQCVFSTQASANWQLFVWSPDMNSGSAFVNDGACYAAVPGGSAACGKAVQDEKTCLERACPQPECGFMDAAAGCVAAANAGNCKTYDDAIMTACASSRAALDAACSDVVAMMKVLCGGGSSDAGSDGD
jgi:hypothetical protein